MRLVLMGTGPFAVPAYQSLLESDHDVAAIFTRPVPAGTSRRKFAENPVLDLAVGAGVPRFAPEDINLPCVHEDLRRLAPELLVVCDFGQILSADTLSIAPLGGINLHGSLLPKYRGAAPINWALWAGETETGVTVIHMTPGLDAGPCLTSARTTIGPREDAVQLEPRLAQLGIRPVHEAIAMLAQWDRCEPLGEMQDPASVSKARRLKKSDGRVDWTRSARHIFNQVRALKPWPTTYTVWNSGKRSVRLILNGVAVASESTVDDVQPGTVVQCDKRHLVVATGAGLLGLEEVQPAGKRAMEIAEFLRGHRIAEGDRFGDA
jgi:methionyl-tRNA formyltransferase